MVKVGSIPTFPLKLIKMNILIHGSFQFTVLDLVTRKPITDGLDDIHSKLRRGDFDIDFTNNLILCVDVPIFAFNLALNNGTEFRFQH